jgi:hypothetical protein
MRRDFIHWQSDILNETSKRENMKTFTKIICSTGLFAISPMVMADQCPDTLNAEQMYDCIVVEGAGGTYKMEDASGSNTSASSGSAEKNSKQQARADIKHSVN